MENEDPPGQRDALFAERRALVNDFNFGPATAVVFDDMLSRSVPHYGELQRMISAFVNDFAIPGSSIYDLGCSTGTTFRNLDAVLPRDQEYRFIGVDSSAAMLEEARAKLAKHGFQRPYELRLGDLNEPLDIHDASVVILMLTLQFVRPLKRNEVIANIYRGMRDGGVLLLVEKVLGEHSLLNRLFVKHYYEFKRANGYSDLEIAQKREALENVLVPYHFQENLDLLRAAGFGQVDIFFKWHNFCGMLAVK